MRGRTDLGVAKVGVMGFSAGGHLASTAATHFTNEINRPDFQILVYPVITMDPSFTHISSRELLLGDNIPQDLQDLYSNEKQVTPNTPPAFILLASDDFLVPVKNSLVYYQALVDNHVSASMHIYPSQGGELCESPAAPCGACRQVMAQYQTKAGTPMSVLLAGREVVLKFDSVNDLLPFIFDNI